MKRQKISKEEIVADVIYIFISALISFIAILIFDIHWSFYPGETVFPPSRNVFLTPEPYYYGIPIGAIIGFFILKLVSYAFMEDEIAKGVLKKKK
ncbi:MAG: hypothetical protein ABH842_01020 [Candidatus Micrarchaeota archaeon]